MVRIQLPTHAFGVLNVYSEDGDSCPGMCGVNFPVHLKVASLIGLDGGPLWHIMGGWYVPCWCIMVQFHQKLRRLGYMDAEMVEVNERRRVGFL